MFGYRYNYSFFSYFRYITAVSKIIENLWEEICGWFRQFIHELIMYFVESNCCYVCLIEGFFYFCYRERLVVAFGDFALKFAFSFSTFVLMI